MNNLAFLTYCGFPCEALQSVELNQIFSDSRQVGDGDLYVALTIDVDALVQYVKNAFAQQAGMVLIEQNCVEAVAQALKLSLVQLNIYECGDAYLCGYADLLSRTSDLAAFFYGQPTDALRVVGVTGTNGKTSCAHFLAQALTQLTQKCAFLGTLGNGVYPQLDKTPFTTDEPVLLQREFRRLVDQGARYASMEVSSHGLAMDRVSAVPFEISVFTNLSRDHLDFHGTMSAYAAAKRKLFTVDGLAAAIFNLDDSYGKQWSEEFSELLPCYGFTLCSSSPVMDSVCSAVVVKKLEETPGGYNVWIEGPWGEGQFSVPLFGLYNVSNVLAVYMSLCLLGFAHDPVLISLASLTPVPGRLEVLRDPNANYAQAVVDYAHTPDALEQCLMAVHSHFAGQVWCVFGCGGDRDEGKRPLMAEVAERLADKVVVTSDNPRTESADQVIGDIMKGFINQKPVVVRSERRAAIEYALKHATPDDVVLIAGKGDENYQLIGGQSFPFRDQAVIEEVYAQ